MVPAHSFKYAATLQNTVTDGGPLLIRIEKNAGHGAGKPTAKLVITSYSIHYTKLYDAKPTADAPFVVDEYNAILSFKRGIYRTNRYARRIIAMLARFRHKISRRIFGSLHGKRIDMILVWS